MAEIRKNTAGAIRKASDYIKAADVLARALNPFYDKSAQLRQSSDEWAHRVLKDSDNPNRGARLGRFVAMRTPLYWLMEAGNFTHPTDILDRAADVIYPEE